MRAWQGGALEQARCGCSKQIVLGLNFTKVQFLCPFIHLLLVPMAAAGCPAAQLGARSRGRRVAWQDPVGSCPCR